MPVTPCTTKKAPWRAPGNWQMPDIIKQNWEKRQIELAKQKPVATAIINEVKRHIIQHKKKKPWIPVGVTPDILPLPPVPKAQKPHAEFEAKLRKILPSSKILQRNPREHYMAHDKVGSGANGAVIRASVRSSRKVQVAIKRCRIEDHDTNHHAFILRELRIMGCMTHPNLIQLREACLADDHLWMCMELMACSVFGLLYNTTIGLSEAYTVRIAKECLEGLVYLHSKNYMHRDIKCENILLGRDGQVKLADFGLATPLNRINQARLGTAKWMAPEVVMEQPYLENVDVWSLAITIIEMMDRVPPLYYLEENREIYGEILYGNPPKFNFTVPSSSITDIVNWMLNPDSQRRPGARLVLVRVKLLIQMGVLQCANQQDLANLVCHVFPDHE
ncbi:p21 protein (Cdc42 Rac)-activated kinase [Apophysomyces ossiformis]|uniref:non-specific serine/threonine protein kinase n=1 Tax=Apophysomyces ossiformis TaxID=679940 RepID=A0A8H7BQU6_9FUNG|nr:p21 protein (Cdc42 Rac)-activated kinase [Apophysomyces ossiformis]